jgi:DNA-binding CsgD family transcriptional regulator
MTFIADACEEKTRDGMARHLMKAIVGLGATRFMCIYMSMREGGYEMGRSLSNIPRDWQLEYLNRGYDAEDPMFQSAVHAGAFGYWSDLLRNQTIDSAGRRVMKFAHDIDMCEGFTRKFDLGGGQIGVMMMAGPDLDRSRLARSAFITISDTFVHQTARVLGSISHVVDTSEFDELSPAQIQVLRLRAEGLSNAQVGVRMQIRPKTVESHVTQIKRRLNARNFLHAVQIGRRLGICF